MELDQKDKIIFESLMQDCRVSVKELARRTHLTHPAVIYRIKNLEKECIQRYDGLINLSKFDTPYSDFLVSVPKKFQKEFEGHFEKDKSIFSIIRHTHKFNYSLNGLIKNIEKIKEYLQKRKLEYKLFTAEKVGFGKFSVFEEIKIPEKEKKFSNKKLELDKLDIKLIEILFHGGGRKSVLELSRELGISAELASYRFKRLNKTGYISSYFAQANPEKFHIRYQLIEFEVKEMGFDEIFNIVNRTKKLSPFFVYDGKGKYQATLFVKSLEESEKAINSIIKELDSKLIDFNIYPISNWLFLNRLNLRDMLKKEE
jgi:DNA-binding Lrp family transcriptional regulator